MCGYKETMESDNYTFDLCVPDKDITIQKLFLRHFEDYKEEMREGIECDGCHRNQMKEKVESNPGKKGKPPKVTKAVREIPASMPQYALFFLKRASYGGDVYNKCKVSYSKDKPLSLNIDNEYTVLYRLRGVINYESSNEEEQHYTCECFDLGCNKWIYYDDHETKCVTKKFNKPKKSYPMFLFYERIGVETN